MVPWEYADRARELVLDFLAVTRKAEAGDRLLEKIRMGMEFMVGGWFFPGLLPNLGYFRILPVIYLCVLVGWLMGMIGIGVLG